jgi:hypothetical protein
MRRVHLFIATAVCLGAGALAAQATGRPQLADAFVAHAVPLAPAGTPALACAAAGAPARHVFLAPSDGRLEASVTSPGWTAVIVDAQGRSASGDAFTEVGAVRASAFVRRNAKVTINACRLSGTARSAVVKYRFLAGQTAPSVRVAKGYHYLAPGQPASLQETVTVNIVVAGYSRSRVPAKTLLDQLPKVSRPVERAPYWYKIKRELGITYTYRYRVTYADQAWQNRFFRYLATNGKQAAPTEFQRMYNDQKANHVVIRKNLRVDAVRVEQYLAKHPPRGVDTTKDTFFLLNWFGRKDFQFHTYRKVDEANDDTKIRLGDRDAFQGIAGGGSAYDDPESGLRKRYRVFFHDLSAGPEQWTGNWEVDAPNIAMRMPPVWEYRAGGPGDPDDLAIDLGLVVRYVGLDTLFTASPLYPVSPTFPVQPSTLVTDTVMYELDARRNVKDAFFNPKAFTAAHRKLARGINYQVGERDGSLVNPQLAPCFAGAYVTALQPIAANVPQGCYPQYPYPIYRNPYVHEAATWATKLPVKAGRHDLGQFVYAMPGDVPDEANLCFAYADDNGVDGTQSMVFAFVNRCLDHIGLTNLLIHETGHHLGMSHPHDGFDWADDEDFGPVGDKQFVWVGTEAFTAMNYSWNQGEFGQFDYDNYDRWLAASYISQAQSIATKVLGKAGTSTHLHAADRAIGRSRSLVAAHRYAEASSAAHAAYAAVLRAAGTAHVRVTAVRDGYHLATTIPTGGQLPPTYANGEMIEVVDGVARMRPISELPGLGALAPRR